MQRGATLTSMTVSIHMQIYMYMLFIQYVSVDHTHVARVLSCAPRSRSARSSFCQRYINTRRAYRARIVPRCMRGSMAILGMGSSSERLYAVLPFTHAAPCMQRFYWRCMRMILWYTALRTILYTIYSLGYTTEVDNLTRFFCMVCTGSVTHAPDKHCPRNSYTAASACSAGRNACVQSRSC